jgi:hypothetical protein
MHLPLHDSETNSEMDHECQRTAKQAQEEMQETIKHALHTLHTLFIQNEANVYRIPSISIVITSISQSPILYYHMAYHNGTLVPWVGSLKNNLAVGVILV